MNARKRMVGAMTLLLALVAATASVGLRLRQHDSPGERMVEQLVNHAKPPFEGYRAEYDEIPRTEIRGILHEQERRVNRAYDTLNDNIEVALPVLAEHLHDKRFSHIRQDPSTDAWHRVDVGMACAEIIQAQIEVYDECVSSGWASLHFIRDGCGGVVRWWPLREDKPLVELQMEACEWVLRHRKKPGWYADDVDWRKALRCVQRKLNKLRASKKPEVRRFKPIYIYR